MVLLLNLYQDLNTILIYFSHYKASKYLLHLKLDMIRQAQLDTSSPRGIRRACANSVIGWQVMCGGKSEKGRP
jgi:hypothetical protein